MEMQKPIHLTGKIVTDMVQLRPQRCRKMAIVPGPKDRMDVLTKVERCRYEIFPLWNTPCILEI